MAVTDRWTEPVTISTLQRVKDSAPSLVALGLTLVLSFWLAAWIHFGVDVPAADDWENYTGFYDGVHGLAYLFKGRNDSIAVLGKIFEACSFAAFDGQGVVFQFLTAVTCLGGILALQFALLQRTGLAPTALAIAFAACLLTLQKGSYWGEQNDAYNQALPIPFLLGALWLHFSPRVAARFRVPLIFLLHVLAGLTYVSGAVGSAMIALVLGTRALQTGKQRPAAMATAVAAVLVLGTQAYYYFALQHGLHATSITPSLPWQPRFWFFAFGILIRSLGLPATKFTLALAVAIFVAVMGMAVSAVRHLRREREDGPRELTAQIFLALLATVGVCVALIAFGRAGFTGTAHSRPFYKFFPAGTYRFHFFWLTLLWPWVAAWGLPKYPRAVAVATAAVLVAFLSYGALNYLPALRANQAMKMRGLDCLARHLRAGTPMLCPELYPGDLTKPFQDAERKGRSFTRLVRARASGR